MAATGQVYIYNTTNTNVKVEVNGEDIEGNPVLAASGSPYAPGTTTAVPRSDALSTTDAVFATNNTMEVKFPGTNNTYATFKIDPGTYQTNTDLVLYIFFNYVIICSPVNNALALSAAPTPSK